MNKKELKKMFSPLVSGADNNLIQRVIFNADYTKGDEKVTISQILNVLEELSIEQEKEIRKYIEVY